MPSRPVPHAPGQAAPPSGPVLPPDAAAALSRAIDIAVPLLLFLLGLGVRLWQATLLTFPGLDDPAFYLLVGRNIAQGRGLVVDAIWSYLVPFTSVTHPSNEFWMPLPSLLLAPLFALFGSSYGIGQLLGAIVGALLVPLTWHTARTMLMPGNNWRAIALLSTVLASLNPVLVYQSVSVDSSAPFATAGAAALLIAAGASGRLLWYAAAGLLAGLAYLSRPEGALFVLLLVAYAALAGGAGTAHGAGGAADRRNSGGERPRRGEAAEQRNGETGRWRASGGKAARLVAAMATAAGALVVVTPWLLRNLLVFGSPAPVPASALAVLPDYSALFHYFPAGPGPLESIDFGHQVGLRMEALLHNLGVLLVQALFPIAPLAVVGAIALRSASLARLGIAATMLLFLFSALVFPVTSLYGTFYHGVGACLPILTVLALAGLLRLARVVGGAFFSDPGMLGGVLGAAAVVLTGVQLVLAMGAVSEAHARWERQFAVLSDWLSAGEPGPVMSNEPYSLLYDSGRPSIMLPWGDPPDTVRRAARDYGVRYIVGRGTFGAYPQALEQDPAFRKLLDQDGVWAYEVEQ